MSKKHQILSYNLTEAELGEARAIQSLIKQEQYKLDLVKGNTALVYKGQECAKMQEDVVKLLNGAFQTLIHKLAKGADIKGKVNINLETGVIRNI